MKLKLLFSMIALLMISITATYASFPVQRTTTDNVTVVEEENDELSSPAAAASGKSQLIALLLVIFVGGIGIHRFYLGYTWQGIVQLLTLGGCGIWALIDLIRIITGDLQPKDGKYSKTL
ncbi:TM2 domain-containing protein [Flavobacterium salilacus subsp. salilacus]|uniref:TM2 domain-containing protein n=1 Tax=Flavobacterium TaxID=237 RepID=UPI001074B6C3|nr:MULTISPECIES: TM2 domain-containing protein [Flavobacterium]KAF2519892.1 TM2 domain-containing protein [Flavobacterium salilacus subsp. salilacus]MBE1614202.1 TM2 domain-containing protein [Flavobacterium sp. SaA2.13]NDI97715.1 TM2 domain-containing protein [Flavobacterium salilacus subsp. altitudinum]